MTDDDRPLVLSGRSWPSLIARTVVITPGGQVPFVDAQWRDCLVVVESGEVELETTTEARHSFGPGDLLWLTGLPLRCLRNPGNQTVVLKALSRRPGSSAEQPSE